MPDGGHWDEQWSEQEWADFWIAHAVRAAAAQMAAPWHERWTQQEWDEWRAQGAAGSAASSSAAPPPPVMVPPAALPEPGIELLMSSLEARWEAGYNFTEADWKDLIKCLHLHGVYPHLSAPSRSSDVRWSDLAYWEDRCWFCQQIIQPPHQQLDCPEHIELMTHEFQLLLDARVHAAWCNAVEPPPPAGPETVDLTIEVNTEVHAAIDAAMGAAAALAATVLSREPPSWDRPVPAGAPQDLAPAPAAAASARTADAPVDAPRGRSPRRACRGSSKHKPKPMPPRPETSAASSSAAPAAPAPGPPPGPVPPPITGPLVGRWTRPCPGGNRETAAARAARHAHIHVRRYGWRCHLCKYHNFSDRRNCQGREGRCRNSAANHFLFDLDNPPPLTPEPATPISRSRSPRQRREKRRRSHTPVRRPHGHFIPCFVNTTGPAPAMCGPSASSGASSSTAGAAAPEPPGLPQAQLDLVMGQFVQLQRVILEGAADAKRRRKKPSVSSPEVIPGAAPALSPAEVLVTAAADAPADPIAEEEALPITAMLAGLQSTLTPVAPAGRPPQGSGASSSSGAGPSALACFPPMSYSGVRCRPVAPNRPFSSWSGSLWHHQAGSTLRTAFRGFTMAWIGPL